MKIPQYVCDMPLDEFLESLDDYGDGHYYSHEAAKRLRDLREALLEWKSVWEYWGPLRVGGGIGCHMAIGRAIEKTRQVLEVDDGE